MTASICYLPKMFYSFFRMGNFSEFELMDEILTKHKFLDCMCMKYKISSAMSSDLLDEVTRTSLKTQNVFEL